MDKLVDTNVMLLFQSLKIGKCAPLVYTENIFFLLQPCKIKNTSNFTCGKRRRLICFCLFYFCQQKLHEAVLPPTRTPSQHIIKSCFHLRLLSHNLRDHLISRPSRRERPFHRHHDQHPLRLKVLMAQQPSFKLHHPL